MAAVSWDDIGTACSGEAMFLPAAEPRSNTWPLPQDKDGDIVDLVDAAITSAQSRRLMSGGRILAGSHDQPDSSGALWDACGGYSRVGLRSRAFLRCTEEPVQRETSSQVFQPSARVTMRATGMTFRDDTEAFSDDEINVKPMMFDQGCTDDATNDDADDTSRSFEDSRANWGGADMLRGGLAATAILRARKKLEDELAEMSVREEAAGGRDHPCRPQRRAWEEFNSEETELTTATKMLVPAMEVSSPEAGDNHRGEGPAQPTAPLRTPRRPSGVRVGVRRPCPEARTRSASKGFSRSRTPTAAAAMVVSKPASMADAAAPTPAAAGEVSTSPALQPVPPSQPRRWAEPSAMRGVRRLSRPSPQIASVVAAEAPAPAAAA